MKNAIEEAFLSLCLEKHGDTEITWNGNADNYVSLDSVKRVDGEDLKFTWDEVLTKKTTLVAEYEAQEYARNREAEYPSIQECVHAILDNDNNELDTLQAKRAETKLKYPKGG